MYWLLGRKAKLSVDNKLLVYKAILKPIWVYGIQLWGNRIHVQHRNTRTLPVEGYAHDNGRIMVCAEYGNTEGSPNPNG
jgi:hypothetical protein